jgi:tight adherence protein B
VAPVNELWVIYGFVFVAAILGIESLYWLFIGTRGAKKAVNRRLALSERNAAKSEVFDILRHERGVSDSSSFAGLNDFLVQTGMRLSKFGLALWTVLTGVAITAVLSVLSINMWIAAIIGLTTGPALVGLYLIRARSKRVGSFARQLPDALDVVVRGLRIGHPFTTAIELVAREMPDPIGTEFGMTADEMSFGQNIETAVNNLYRRVGQDDLRLLVIAVTVQGQTGGNLAEVLARLSTLMRERFTLKLKIRALSSEGRLSAWILSLMPFILVGVVSLMSKDYFAELTGSPLLGPTLIYSGGSLVIANIFIYRMVNFKV